MRAVVMLALVGCVAPTAPTAPAQPAHVELRHAVQRYAFDDASENERRLFTSINDARAAAGLRALVWSDQVSFIAHPASSPRQVDFGELALSDLSVFFATADSIDAVAQAWLSDDRQRAHFLSPDATQIGIAVDASTDKVTSTAIVFRTPHSIDTAAFAARIEAAMESRERKRDGDLQTIAQTVATSLAAGWRREDVEALIQSRLRGPDRRWTKIRNSMTRLVDVGALESDHALAQKLLDGQRADDIGVGVAQGAHPETGDGAIWIVVMFAETPDEMFAKQFGDMAFH